ncbi:cytosolic sulfotransferase 1-like [Durio zibethinus]|uniref:Sulfotransferase n=1 Tax=Durio zibethinus TaxID=66656 RepID=A0A6P5YMM5_DURZI|nr:cytosolic sulfotransferase 1-like [Durio zibethinus]
MASVSFKSPSLLFVSKVHVSVTLTQDASACQEAYGPFGYHVWLYWKASLESPKKVLFMKYEDMKKEPLVCVRKLAEFLGLERPFSSSDYFRKDLVGDWVNHLTPEMAEILDRITKEKFQGTGLSFQ